MDLLIVGTIVLSLISPVSYTKSMLAGKSRPHRVTRLIVWLASLAGVLGVLEDAAGAAQIFAAIFLVRATYLLVMSFIYGVGGRTTLDTVCIALGLGALVVFVVTGSGLLAVAFGILADLIGYIPTFVKTYKEPKSEDPGFFALEAAAALLGVLAVGSLQIGIAFPVYFVVSSVAVLALIYRPQLTRLMVGR